LIPLSLATAAGVHRAVCSLARGTSSISLSLAADTAPARSIRSSRFKVQLARRMIERAVAAGVAFGWVAGDEVYGDNGPLRAWLEERDIAHVLAVACRHRLPAGAGPALRADELAARLPKRAWQQLPAGEGAKGKRYYD
jgi:SRSO17 transposase